MCIRVEWSNEAQTAIRIVYEKGWNWRDHQLALDAVNALLDTVAHPVDLLFELEHSMPQAEDTAWSVAQSGPLHPNWSGRLVVVSADEAMARAILEATPALADPQAAAEPG